MLLLMLCACYLHHAVSGSLHRSSCGVLGLHSNAGRSPILPYPLHYDAARRTGFEQMQHQEYWPWPVPMKDISHPLSLSISQCIVTKGRWIVLFTALLLSTRICCFEIICALPARRIVDYAVALAYHVCRCGSRRQRQHCILIDVIRTPAFHPVTPMHACRQTSISIAAEAAVSFF